MEHQGGVGCIEIGGYGLGGLAGLFGVQVHVLFVGTCVLRNNNSISLKDLNK
jgi:hypothetical protein